MLALLASSLIGLIAGNPQARVIDGDTLALDGTTYRLEGIDAPEINQPCERDESIWYCGADAKAALIALIGNAKVTCDAGRLDYYGRTLGTCYATAKRAERINLNAEMVAQGWAVAYRDNPLYQPQEDQARQAGAGIWSGQFFRPWNWRRLSKR